MCIHGSVNGCKPHFLLTPSSRISAHFHFIGIRFTYGRELALAACRPHVAFHKATKHPADSPCFQTGSQYRPALLKYSNLVWNRKLSGLLEATELRLSMDDFTGRKQRASRYSEQLAAHTPEQTPSLPSSAQGERAEPQR